MKKEVSLKKSKIHIFFLQQNTKYLAIYGYYNVLIIKKTTTTKTQTNKKNHT